MAPGTMSDRMGNLHSGMSVAGLGLNTSESGDSNQGCRGEKSVRARNVESIFSTSLPLASDLSRTVCHSGSSRKACQLAVAASRFGCARMYTSVLPLRGSSVGVQYAMF